MRALCESCGALQPPDWQAGDLCGSCGAVVRREKRCPWCAQLTPDGKFCRHCGSGTVPDALYGAARMLKVGGVDQFSLPERLGQMDPAQLEHLSRLYAPHEAVLERHVDDLAFVEGFLRQGGWSRALENEMLPRLPLAADLLQALTLPPARAVSDIERLEEIRDSSPLPQSGQLAALAHIRLGAPRGEADATKAEQALGSSEMSVRLEAALTLGHWRFTSTHPYGAQVRDLKSALYEAYQAYEGKFALEAAVGLSLLAQHYSPSFGDPQVEVPRAALASEDPDTAFGAALALGETEMLLPALRVSLILDNQAQPLKLEQRYAAALALARAGHAAPLAPILLELEPHEQERILETVRYKVGVAPELHDLLVHVLEQNSSWSLRNTAAHLLALENRLEDALRLIEADTSFVDAVLRNPALSPHELERVCLKLLETGNFNLYQMKSLTELATSGRVPDSFVPQVFAGADEYGRQELCSFAGQQLLARRNQTLHRFLWSVLDGDWPHQARERAWNALSSWYSLSREGEEPLRLTLESLRHYFGSVGSFLEQLCELLERPDILRSLHRYDDFLMVLQEVEVGVLPAVRERASLLERLRKGLWSMVYDGEAYSSNRGAGLRLLGQLADSRTEREAFCDELRGLLETDPPWDLRRTALETLSAQERQTLRLDLQALLGKGFDFGQRGGEPLEQEQRDIATTLLDQLEAMD